MVEETNVCQEQYQKEKKNSLKLAKEKKKTFGSYE
jgi:hypothetical protein